MKKSRLPLFIFAMLSFSAGSRAGASVVQYTDPATGFVTEIDSERGDDSTVITPSPEASALSLMTGDDPSPFAPGEKIPLPVPRPRPEDGPALKSTDLVKRAKFTVYNPNVNDSMEGGGRNRHGEKINSVEDAAVNGRPVTLSGDYVGKFGAACNQKYRRCTLLVIAPGFDGMFPAYRKKFPNLPRNSFIGIVEDTGRAFVGSQGNHFDIAVRSRFLTFTHPVTIASARWFVIASPCGQSAGARSCNLAQAHLEPTSLAMIMN